VDLKDVRGGVTGFSTTLHVLIIHEFRMRQPF
jgi:hypothetical protein